jgi:hypothetical protein
MLLTAKPRARLANIYHVSNDTRLCSLCCSGGAIRIYGDRWLVVRTSRNARGNLTAMIRSPLSYHRMRAALGAAILFVLSGNSAPAAAAARYVKVAQVAPGHVLWMHSGPGHHFQRVGFLPHGARQIRAYTCKALATGSWCQVRYRGTRGWASKRFLAKDSARFAKALVPPDRRDSADSQEEWTSGLLSPAGVHR